MSLRAFGKQSAINRRKNFDRIYINKQEIALPPLRLRALHSTQRGGSQHLHLVLVQV